MSKITVLDDRIINLIAAGEVVERPFSVVKELVENSIDAKATEITIEIKNGGIDLIRVTDNGIGMNKEDAILAWQRHATSKITSEVDLYRIGTLGFRGEALASIAAVAQITLQTKEKNSLVGTKVSIAGGKIENIEEIGCSEGTSLAISNLFFNTPARRKFLKSPTSESAQIGELITKLAITHPEIAFKYYNNNQSYLNTSGCNTLNNVLAIIYGKPTINKLLEINSSFDGINLHGFISNPDYTRGQKNHITWVVNGRYIVSEYLTNILLEGYHTLLQKGRFPFAVIHINIDPSLIDINIHPSKLDIRFENPQILKEIKSLISNKLYKHQEPLFNIPLPKMEYEQEPFTQTTLSSSDNIPNFKNEYLKSKAESIPYIKENQNKYEERIEPLKDITKNNKTTNTNQVIISEQKNWNNKDFKIIGQYSNTFILLELEGDLYLVDQHTAHERILYEKYMKKAENGSWPSQELLVPITLSLVGQEEGIVIENILNLQKLGIILEHFGTNTFLVRALPTDIKENPKEFMMDLIDTLKDRSRNLTPSIVREQVLILASCKSAIKANQRITYSDMNYIIENWLKSENPHTCPHGRPISYKISYNDLLKYFKRI